MIRINGKEFYDMPGSCATCPFFFSGDSGMCHPDTGLCTLFNEKHKVWIDPPKRCAKLFRKAFRMPDGSDLVSVNAPISLILSCNAHK